MEEESRSDATVRPWADLVPDLLRHISGSIRDAPDFVRFHAVCSTWRDTTSSSHYPPSFLPWLLGPGSQSHPSIALFRSIFSKKRTTWCAPGTYSRRHRWLVTEDGTATWLLAAGGSSHPRLINPFTGAAAILPPLPPKIRGSFPLIDGIVCSDGTIFLHAIQNVNKQSWNILAAVLQPGAAWWDERQMYLIHNGVEGHFTAAYYKDSVVLLDPCQKYMVALGTVTGFGCLTMHVLPTKHEDGLQHVRRPRGHSVHVFESRGKLLAACVVLRTSPESKDLVSALSVWIYAMELEFLPCGGHAHRWVRRDGWSLMKDRVLFLGCPTSFVVDADGDDGGCTYFVLNSRNVGWFGRLMPEASRVYRYSFKDGRATEVDELPLSAGWKDDMSMMWVKTRPSTIAPVQQIRERLLQTSSSKKAVPRPITSIIRYGRAELGPPFKIFVGNLPSGIHSSQLKQFFHMYGDVIDERIIHDPKTGKSYGYGFVTMATFEEPAEFFATIEGENFCGHALRVKKSARTKRRPKGPFVMPLLTQNTKA